MFKKESIYHLFNDSEPIIKRSHKKILSTPTVFIPPVSNADDNNNNNLSLLAEIAATDIPNNTNNLYITPIKFKPIAHGQRTCDINTLTTRHKQNIIDAISPQILEFVQSLVHKNIAHQTIDLLELVLKELHGLSTSSSSSCGPTHGGMRPAEEIKIIK
jgi:hypothetical protein